MKKIMIFFVTLGALLVEILLSYVIPIGWVLILAIAMMGLFIILHYKNLALGVVLAIFLFGMILPLKHNYYYTSLRFTMTKDLIIDKKHHKMFAINPEDIQKIKKLDTNKTKYIACQYATLFGKRLAEHFCYFIAGDQIFEIKELR